MRDEPSLKIVMVGNIPEPLRDVLLQATAFTRQDDAIKYLYKKKHCINTHKFSLNLHDSTQVEAGGRQSLYSLTRIFLLVFDLNDPDSLTAIREKYYAEIYHPRQNQISFASVLMGIREKSLTPETEKTHEAIIQTATEFAQTKNTDLFIVRSLDNSESMQAFIDLVTVAGLTKQPERIGLAQQCYEYLEHKKAEENFIDLCLTLTTASTPVHQLKLILFLIAKVMLRTKRSDNNIKTTIDSIMEYAQAKPRIWNTATRLTLFKTNPHYTETKLHRDPEPRLSTTLFQR